MTVARGVLLGPGCRLLRQRLPAFEWIVLEDVALDAGPGTDGRAIAPTSARAIAANLDVDPAAVATALSRLRSLGLIDHAPAIDTPDRFGLLAYVLMPHPGLNVVDLDRVATDPRTVPRAPSSSPRSARTEHAEPAQLTLLGNDVAHPQAPSRS